jgi:hypothetical protein
MRHSQAFLTYPHFGHPVALVASPPQVDMRGFEFFPQAYDPKFPNLVHLTKDGQVAYGKAMANQYLEHLSVLERKAAEAAADQIEAVSSAADEEGVASSRTLAGS